MTFGPYGTGDTAFIQMAEDSSRPAFQSIESIVQAVHSVSMMLESTYSALYRQVSFQFILKHHNIDLFLLYFIMTARSVQSSVLPITSVI